MESQGGKKFARISERLFVKYKYGLLWCDDSPLPLFSSRRLKSVGISDVLIKQHMLGSFIDEICIQCSTLMILLIFS